jgi:hypothetical protein
MSREIRAFGRDVTVEVVGGLALLALVAMIRLIRPGWITSGVSATWTWLGSDRTTQNWILVLLAIGSTLAAVCVVRSASRRWRGSKRPLPAHPEPPIAESERFHDAFNAFTRAFVGWRERVTDYGDLFENEWLDEYRDLRRDAQDALSAIRVPLREWLDRVDDVYLTRYPNEPFWADPDTSFDEDGNPIEDRMDLIEKLLMPHTLPAAIGFWVESDSRELRGLVAERADLIAIFIRSLRGSRLDEEPEPRASVRSRIMRYSRRRKQKARRKRQEDARKLQHTKEEQLRERTRTDSSHEPGTE